MNVIHAISSAVVFVSLLFTSMPSIARPDAAVLPRPLAVSANSEWVVYGDGADNLHRVSSKNSLLHQILPVTATVTSVSASRTALRVLFATVCDGVGLVDFSQPILGTTWIETPHNGCLANGQSDTFKYSPIAIAPDGERFARHHRANKVTVYNSMSGEPTLEFPLARLRSNVVHLEFLAGNKLLFVVESKKREESSQTPVWDNSFSFWNLETRQLNSGFESQTSAPLSANTVLSISHFAGDAWSTSNADDGTGPLELVRFAATGCRDAEQRYRMPPRRATSDHMVVDSFGRWLALSKSGNQSNSIEKPEISFFDISGNTAPDFEKVIARLLPRGNISQMRASLDGTTMWATMDDGRIERYDVPREALSPSPTRAPSKGGPCLAPDEAANARNIDNSSSSHHVSLVKEIPLVAWPVPFAACRDRDFSPWIFTRDGEILNDAGLELIFYDSTNGRELRRLPIPRSPNVCARLLPEARAFLTYQGDTFAIQPWAGELRLLDRRPGWIPIYVWVRNYGGGKLEPIVFVIWMPRGPLGQDKTAEGVSAAYSVITGKLVNQAKVKYCNDNDSLPKLSCPQGRSAVTLNNQELELHGLNQKYFADVGLYQSLAVHESQSPTAPETVIFREGFAGDALLDTVVDQFEKKVDLKAKVKSKQATRLVEQYYLGGHTLNENWVVGLRGDSAKVFDFRSRRLVASIPEQPEFPWLRPLWNARDNLLWIVAKQKGVQAWRIESKNPLPEK